MKTAKKLPVCRTYRVRKEGEYLTSLTQLTPTLSLGSGALPIPGECRIVAMREG
jgi:hypothetical protein